MTRNTTPVLVDLGQQRASLEIWKAGRCQRLSTTQDPGELIATRRTGRPVVKAGTIAAGGLDDPPTGLSRTAHGFRTRLRDKQGARAKRTGPDAA